jgi:CspA family cold shock protein
MPKGMLKFFNVDRGYGFMTPDDGGTDVFVHITAVEAAGMGTIKEGQIVSFEIENDPRSGKARAGPLKPASGAVGRIKLA